MQAGRIGSVELVDLVARHAERNLRCKVIDLERLARVVVTPEGAAGIAEVDKDDTIDARLEFLPGAEGFPQLRLQAKCTLMLRCQRCLEAFPWPLELAAQLTILGSEADVARVADPLEVIVMTEDGLSPAEILEDEVLAALPLSPMHAPGECRGPAATEYPISADEPVLVNKPFADLGALLGRRDRRTDD